MMLKIAFRNIFRQKRRTILTALTMFGGFILAAISIGWSDGTYEFVINMFTRNRLGHIQIHYQDYRSRASIFKTIDNYKQIGQKLAAVDQVQYWTPRLFSGGLVSVDEKSTGASITGVDPTREDETTRFSKQIKKGKILPANPSHQAVLGIGLAEVLEADVSDTVIVVSQAADGSIANDLYKISGIIESGDIISDRMTMYLHLADAQELLALQGQVHEIAIIVSKLDEVDEVSEKIQSALNDPNLEVAPWQVFAKSFYQAMQADQEGMWISLFVIILIVAVGILNTVLMSVLERRREYGLLKAIGTKPKQIFQLVLSEVTILAVASIIVGAVLGSLANYALSHQGIALPQAFTYGGIEFTKMYSTVNARSLYLPAATVLITAIIVSTFPAIRAAKSDPAKAMRIH